VSPLRTWLGDADAIPVLDAASVSQVRERVRAEGARIGLDAVAAASLVNVASELAHNQLAHARSGRVVVRDAVRAGARGLEVVAADRGPGIADVARALEGRGSTRGSLGVGLAAVCELADEVDVDVRIGEGTCVWARKFPGGAAGAAARRRRVGVYGRAYPGERVSGDDAAFRRVADTLVVGLADGLGHGDPAREASARAVRLLAESPSAAFDAVLGACHGKLAHTRGAVMTMARIEGAGGVEIAGVGNVGAHGYALDAAWRFGGSSFVLGAPGAVLRVANEQRRVDARGMVVLFSDGIRARMDLSGERDLLREHPVVVAQRVVERFARDDDDVLVVVVS
jgi:anti-sigma regulatory factor (Ser/Thr protein kinase)